MKLGVAIAEAIRPVREPFLRALDARETQPEIVPLWSRRSQSPDGQHWHVDPTLLDALHERGTEPVIYMESTGASYPDILTGAHDDELRLLACKADGHVIRWDQEPDGDFGQDWAGHELYADVFQHVSEVMRSEADIRLMWCVIKPLEAISEGYWPGDEAVQVVGFDRYSWTEGSNFPDVQWRAPVKQLQKLVPGLPIRVGECGRLAGLTRRGEWLRSARSVAGIEAVTVMDMLEPSLGHDWRFDAAMHRAAAEWQA